MDRRKEWGLFWNCKTLFCRARGTQFLLRIFLLKQLFEMVEQEFSKSGAIKSGGIQVKCQVSLSCRFMGWLVLRGWWIIRQFFEFWSPFIMFILIMCKRIHKPNLLNSQPDQFLNFPYWHFFFDVVAAWSVLLWLCQIWVSAIHASSNRGLFASLSSWLVLEHLL